MSTIICMFVKINIFNTGYRSLVTYACTRAVVPCIHRTHLAALNDSMKTKIIMLLGNDTHLINAVQVQVVYSYKGCKDNNRLNN